MCLRSWKLSSLLIMMLMWQSSIIFICSGEIVTVDDPALEIPDVAKENQGQLSQLFVYTTYQVT